MADKHFWVDTNQQHVCTKCGNRWHAVHVNQECQRCATVAGRGGQILPPEPEEEAPVAKKKSTKKKSD